MISVAIAKYMSYIIVNKKVQKVVFDFHYFDTHHTIAITDACTSLCKYVQLSNRCNLTN